MIKFIISVESKCDGNKPVKVYFSRVVESSDDDIPYSSIIASLHYLFCDIPHNINIKISEL